MTLLSVTQCCRLLAIDAKTLHRWLAQAQLPLQAHPSDARLKGLSREHLLLVATAHHRRLAALSEELPALAAPPLPQEPPPLPQDLLALLSTLSELPAQIAALQQQLTALTQLMAQAAVTPSPGPVLALEPAAPPAAVRSYPAASRAPKPLPKPAHVLALVEYASQGHYVVICPKHGLLPFEPESPQWFAWLATLSSFRFVGQHGRLTAHREVERVPRGAWRAHRNIRNHTSNLRLGSTEALTIAVLEQAAADLQAHLK
jgi:hypothetical protein